MQNPAISVIIPVYNQEKYVGKCIRSVLGQSFQDFEIIVVNDGSHDGTLDVCRKYSEKDHRISIIDKPYGGLAQARKDGFLLSKGEYVCFLDSDDYLEKDALESLFSIGEKYAVDVIIGNFDRCFDNWKIVRKRVKPFPNANRIIRNQELWNLTLKMSWDDLTLMLVLGRLYRRSCIMDAIGDPMLFPQRKDAVLEDDMFNLAIAPFVRSIWICNDVLYHYRYGGFTCYDFPYIRKGWEYFAYKYEVCLSEGRWDCLPNVLLHYSNILLCDMTNQLHYYHSDNAIKAFFMKEISERKIVKWAQQQLSELPYEIRDSDLVLPVLNGDVNAFLSKVEEREQFLWKHHYWKKRLLRYYQQIADRIGLVIR